MPTLNDLRALDNAIADISAGEIERGSAQIRHLASTGLPQAAHQWARLQLFGLTPIDISLPAAAALQQAIEGGDAGAAYTRAVWHCGLSEPGSQWIDDLWISAEAGHPLAWRSLGVIAAGLTHPRATHVAAYCLEQAMRRGDPLAEALRPALPREAAAHEEARALPWIDAVSSLPALPDQDLSALHPRAFAPFECLYLRWLALPFLAPSQVSDPNSGQHARLRIRTSDDAQIDPMLEDAATRLLQRRLASATGLALQHAEPAVVLRYLPGQEYRPHRDILPPSILADPMQGRGGQRAATAIIYLNDVAEGGETEFPLRGLRIPARVGQVLAFRNTDATGQTLESSLHAGLPVRSGEKWILTLWLRHGSVRDC